jgi:hypothetical protein
MGEAEKNAGEMAAPAWNGKGFLQPLSNMNPQKPRHPLKGGGVFIAWEEWGKNSQRQVAIIVPI